MTTAPFYRVVSLTEFGAMPRFPKGAPLNFASLEAAETFAREIAATEAGVEVREHSAWDKFTVAAVLS